MLMRRDLRRGCGSSNARAIWGTVVLTLGVALACGLPGTARAATSPPRPGASVTTCNTPTAGSTDVGQPVTAAIAGLCATTRSGLLWIDAGVYDTLLELQAQSTKLDATNTKLDALNARLDDVNANLAAIDSGHGLKLDQLHVDLTGTEAPTCDPAVETCPTPDPAEGVVITGIDIPTAPNDVRSSGELPVSEGATRASIDMDGETVTSQKVRLADHDRERLDLAWWGLWAIAGLMMVSLIAPMWSRAWRWWSA